MPSASNVKATFWAEQSDSGGCQLPTANYGITDALGLGQETALGSLAWRPGMCGQVVDIDCGNGVVSTVVANTCGLGNDQCGINLLGKTWRKATANATPGIASCNVSLTSKNPIQGTTNQCYHRPNSDNNNQYSTIIGLLNTNGQLVKSASVAGVQGINHNSDGWYEFNGNGKPLFNDNAIVVFTFEDGSNVQLKLSVCKNGQNTQIFK